MILTKEEQRYGRNKDTCINHTYIESGEYRRKFDKVSNNAELNRLLYNLAKKILCHRSGTLYEDMYWINTNPLSVIAKETESRIEKRIKYSRKTKKKIRAMQGLITMHSHPNSFPPSLDDFNSNYKHEFGLGIICCHDGKIYTYRANEEIPAETYYTLTSDFYNQYHDAYLAQIKALEVIQNKYDISFKEVQ